jgi:hypothetical protein
MSSVTVSATEQPPASQNSLEAVLMGDAGSLGESVRVSETVDVREDKPAARPSVRTLPPVATSEALGPVHTIFKTEASKDPLVPTDQFKHPLLGASQKKDEPTASGSARTDDPAQTDSEPKSEDSKPPESSGENQPDSEPKSEDSKPPGSSEGGQISTPAKKTVNFVGLIKAGKETANTRYMYVIVKKGGKDPLKNGPMAIDLYTCTVSNDITSLSTFPRFIPVVMSHYMESERDYFYDKLEEWQGFVELMLALKGEDTEIYESVLGGVNLILREFSAGTYMRINAIKLIQSGTMGFSYNPSNDMKRWIDRFFHEVDECANKFLKETETNALIADFMQT